MDETRRVPSEEITEIMDRARAEQLGLRIFNAIEALDDEEAGQAEGGSWPFGESQTGAVRCGYDLK